MSFFVGTTETLTQDGAGQKAFKTQTAIEGPKHIVSVKITAGAPTYQVELGFPDGSGGKDWVPLDGAVNIPVSGSFSFDAPIDSIRVNVTSGVAGNTVRATLTSWRE